MSRATKRKHVFNELLNDEIKLPNENELLCRITMSRGNNLHEVETSQDEVFLASMPSKFRRNVWVKRGDFVLLERIDEGNKVKGEIVRVLTRDHIKYYKSQGVWPSKFDNSSSNESQMNEGAPQYDSDVNSNSSSSPNSSSEDER